MKLRNLVFSFELKYDELKYLGEYQFSEPSKYDDEPPFIHYNLYKNGRYVSFYLHSSKPIGHTTQRLSSSVNHGIQFIMYQY